MHCVLKFVSVTDFTVLLQIHSGDTVLMVSDPWIVVATKAETGEINMVVRFVSAKNH